MELVDDVVGVLVVFLKKNLSKVPFFLLSVLAVVVSVIVSLFIAFSLFDPKPPNPVEFEKAPKLGVAVELVELVSCFNPKLDVVDEDEKLVLENVGALVLVGLAPNTLNDGAADVLLVVVELEEFPNVEEPNKPTFDEVVLLLLLVVVKEPNPNELVAD